MKYGEVTSEMNIWGNIEDGKQLVILCPTKINWEFYMDT
jgi:hypothetical protein